MTIKTNDIVNKLESLKNMIANGEYRTEIVEEINFLISDINGDNAHDEGYLTDDFLDDYDFNPTL